MMEETARQRMNVHQGANSSCVGMGPVNRHARIITAKMTSTIVRRAQERLSVLRDAQPVG